MALIEHQTGFLDRTVSSSSTGEALRVEDELDRVQMDIEAGRLSEARTKFVRMDRALRESPRALSLRAKSSPSRDSKELLAAMSREGLRRTSDPLSRLYLIYTLALCGDYQTAADTLPAIKDVPPGYESLRSEIVKLLGGDPHVEPDRRSKWTRWIDRVLGFETGS